MGNSAFFCVYSGIGLVATALSLGLVGCKSDSIPPGVPQGASYDRKTNLYSHQAEGFAYRYNKQGKMIDKTQVNEGGQFHGIYEAYLQTDGKKITWGTFEKGQRHGTWTWTFENGSPYVVQNFTYGKKRSFWIPTELWGNEDGLYQRFYPDGKVEEQGFFNAGYRDGDWVKYYPDKKLEYAGRYKSGKKVGAWSYYYPNGGQEAMEDYTADGKLVFRATYYPNGKTWCLVKLGQAPQCMEP